MTVDPRCRAWLHIAGQPPRRCTQDIHELLDTLHTSEDGWRWLPGRKATPPTR